MANPSKATALVLAPIGRDSAVAAQLLAENDIEPKICADFQTFVRSLNDDTSFGMLAEEALRAVDLKPLLNLLAAQPTWSDVPLLILTHRGAGPDRNPEAARLADLLGNVTYLERPFHLRTFRSVARSAVKARERQFEARARIEELHESKENLQTALLAGELGSWELDLDRRRLTSSPTCKANFGLPPDAAFSFEDLIRRIHPDDVDRIKKSVKRSLRTGADYSIEYRTIWPDGSCHWVDIHARIVTTSADRRRRLVGVSADITQRKAAEQNLRQLNETLEERVNERTRELRTAHAAVLAEIAQREITEEKLRQAQKLELIGQLTGGVAHDFNNLLMAVLGNLHILGRRLKDDPGMMRLIEGAIQGARRGASLTQRLLAFARRQDLQVKPVDLNVLVGGMIELLERSAGNQIELQIRYADAPTVALIDENQVELALLNLVVNARDAMPEGGCITIEIDQQTIPTAASGETRFVRLVVSDTGRGMDADTLRRATEPFFSTKELGKGTGLGLSMIHGLAVQLKGSLKLSSEVGRGTRAELCLPATEIVPVPVRPIAPDSPPAQIGRPLKILVVDDDALIAMSTVDMLEDLGHQTLSASSGEQALEIIRAVESLDMVITDFSMPKMTGAQLASAARQVRPNLPILLASGFADIPDDYQLTLPRLGKPYQQEQLVTEISRLMAAPVS